MERGSVMAEGHDRQPEKEENPELYLKRNPLIASVQELMETDSTNRVAKELAVSGAPEGTLIMAKRQSGGKGRLGRSFFSPEGGIYMSMILRPQIPAERAVLITTCAAVAVACAIETVCGITAGIKWVNDIFVQGKKVCGILAEAGLNPDTAVPDYVILGIGINVEKQSVPEELKEIVGCLEDGGVVVSKPKLIAAVWEKFDEQYRKLSAAEYMGEYKRRSILLGKEVTVLSPEGDYKATVTDIDKEGRLVIERDGVKQKLSFGEVSVRIS